MQPTKKISQLPPQASPTTSDKIPLVSGGTTDYSLVSDLIALFFNNIPTGAHSDVTRATDTFFDFVKANTGVWTADNVGVNRNASMTAMTVYINGRRITVSAVTARTFTASKDTYIDVLDNLDGTGTLVYTEATNNAASAALASNSVRVGIIVTGATTIAATSSVNQGQEDRVLPIASSVPYAVTDSLGNLICPRDPTRKLLGLKQIIANFSTASVTAVQVTGLSCPVIVPLTRKIKAKVYGANVSANGVNTLVSLGLWDGTVGSGTQLNEAQQVITNSGVGDSMDTEDVNTPTSASKTFNASLRANVNTATLNTASTVPSLIKIELE